MKKAKILILSGEIQAGKTTLCGKIADLARDRGLELGGVISPPVYEQGRKTAIDVEDVRTGETRRLAVLRGREEAELTTRRWQFLPESVRWGNQILETAVPCGLLMVDELGPLELERGKGWTAGLTSLDSGQFQGAVVVIRPHLVDAGLARWPGASVAAVSSRQRGLLGPEEILHRLSLGNPNC